MSLRSCGLLTLLTRPGFALWQHLALDLGQFRGRGGGFVASGAACDFDGEALGGFRRHQAQNIGEEAYFVLDR